MGRRGLRRFMAVVVDEGDANWPAIHVGKLRASTVDVREFRWP